MNKLQILTLIFLFTMQFNNAFAQVSPTTTVKTAKAQDNVMPKAIELYNKKLYQEALELLEKNQSIKDINPQWYYYRGLCFARLEKYDDAILSLEMFSEKAELQNSSRAFYFIGLMQFYKGLYERSISTLDVALDLSKDPKLDRSIDNLIDKVIRYNNYYKNRKSTNLSFLLGYSYDTNVIDISQSLSETRLSGHVLNYGFSASHRVIDKINLVIEPSLTVLDTYSFSDNFKSEATLQQADILQGILTIPVVFNTDKEQSNTQYELSLNGFTSFVPVNSSKRDQYLSSQYFKGRVSTDINNEFRVALSATYASEKSVTIIDEDSNATGIKTDARLVFSQYLSKKRDKGIGYELGMTNKSAIGIDSRYVKGNLSVGFWAPAFYEMTSLYRLTGGQMKYPDRIDKRIDDFVSLDLYFSKRSEEHQHEWNFLLGAVYNKSNVEVNTYNDIKLGIAYTKQFGF